MGNKKRAIKVVSLFSGCGGLDLGLHLAKHQNLKYQIEWANDFFESACRTFAKNFKVRYYDNPAKEVSSPSVYCGDISNFKFKERLGDKKIDIVIGGFPCQDFSLLRGKGNRGGVNVKRGRLYMHFVRTLIELQPQIFIAENVKGLISANKGQAFKRITEDFENLNIFSKEIEEDCRYKLDKEDIQGYCIIHKDVVDFSKVGVPQKRQRLIIMGVRKDLVKENQVEEFSNRLKKIVGRNSFSQFPLTTLEVLSGKTVDKLNDEYRFIMKEFKENINKLKSDRKDKFMKDVWNKLSFDALEDYLKSNSIKNNKNINEALTDHEKKLKDMGFFGKSVELSKFFDKSNELFNEIKRVRDRMAHIPPGENHEFVKNTEHHVQGLMSNIYKRIQPLKPSPTIIASGGGGTWGYHYSINRQRLTNRERARIQTFPDWFMFKGTASEIRTQLGNAVPPFGIKPFAEEILNIFEDIN